VRKINSSSSAEKTRLNTDLTCAQRAAVVTTKYCDELIPRRRKNTHTDGEREREREKYSQLPTIKLIFFTHCQLTSPSQLHRRRRESNDRIVAVQDSVSASGSTVTVWPATPHWVGWLASLPVRAVCGPSGLAALTYDHVSAMTYSHTHTA